jgi:hypothetical protein
LGAIYCTHGHRLEKAIHFLLRKNRIASEWFELNDDELNNIVALFRTHVIPVNVMVSPSEAEPLAKPKRRKGE